jgi:hypothetical protein
MYVLDSGAGFVLAFIFALFGRTPGTRDEGSEAYDLLAAILSVTFTALAFVIGSWNGRSNLRSREITHRLVRAR